MKSDSAEKKTSRGRDRGMRGRREKVTVCYDPRGSRLLIPASLEKDKVVITKPRHCIPPHGAGGGGMRDATSPVLHFSIVFAMSELS